MKRISIKQKTILILTGLFLCVVSLEIGLRMAGFIILSLQEYRNRISMRQKGAYRIMCLGESTTAGMENYPILLEEILNQRDIGIKFSVINKGRGGIDTGAIVSRLEYNLNKYTPDMVTTMMGINDRRPTIAYEDIPTKKVKLFFTSFRIYKLAKLLQLHIINKAREIRVCKSKENITHQARDLTSSSTYNDQDNSAEEPEEATQNNYQVYLELGWRYQRQGIYAKAEDMYKKAIQINSRSAEAHLELARCYRMQEYYDKAEEILKNVIQINPENDRAHLRLGRCYIRQGYSDKAEEILKKAIQINPNNDDAYLELAFNYKRLGAFAKTEEILKKAIQINPKNDQAYFELGFIYDYLRAFAKTEEMFKNAIQINPKNDQAHLGLGRCYIRQGYYDKAEKILKKAIQIIPDDDRVYGALAHCYQEWGRHKLADAYFRRANRLRTEYYHPITRHNYQGLKEILDQRGIKLVCIQYPVRSVEPLKRLFDNQEGVLFVDNEGVFKEALKQASYDEYFLDMFAGDFGHCSPKGNRLLAENIADVILRECFNK